VSDTYVFDTRICLIRTFIGYLGCKHVSFNDDQYNSTTVTNKGVWVVARILMGLKECSTLLGF